MTQRMIEQWHFIFIPSVNLQCNLKITFFIQKQ